MSKQLSLTSFFRGRAKAVGDDDRSDGTVEGEGGRRGEGGGGGEAMEGGSGQSDKIVREQKLDQIEESPNTFDTEVMPPDKRAKTDAENKTKDQSKQTTNRAFKESWKIGHDWLHYNSEKKIMTCKTCSMLSKKRNASFVVGCSTLKLEQVNFHAKSQEHINNTKIERAKKAKLEDTEAGKSLHSLNSAQVENLNKLFWNAHFIGKETKPLSDFRRLATLDEAKGLNTGDAYTNIMSLKEFLQCIADIERREIKTLFEQADFFAILSDGSVDSATIEEEIVYCKFVVKGKVYVVFIGIQSVEKPDAQNITAAIRNVLLKHLGIDEKTLNEKLISVVSDGASVMTGKYTGVVVQLKGDNDYVVTIHCLPHRLELGIKDSLQCIAIHKKVNSLLKALYKFYHKSAVNRAGLKANFQKQGKNSIFPKRVTGTRWVDHELEALKSFEKGYPFIVGHLESIVDGSIPTSAKHKATANGILKKMKNVSVLSFALKLKEVMAILSKLSRTLQEREINLG